jgi:ATP-dependent DNA ligase
MTLDHRPGGRPRKALFFQVPSQECHVLHIGPKELFPIVGYTAGRRGVTELLLGLADDKGELHYVGRVEHGLDERLARDLLPRLDKLRRAEPALAPSSRPKGTKGVVWVKPTLEACVAFRGISFGHLRHAVLKGVEEVG